MPPARRGTRRRSFGNGAPTSDACARSARGAARRPPTASRLLQRARSQPDAAIAACGARCARGCGSEERRGGYCCARARCGRAAASRWRSGWRSRRGWAAALARSNGCSSGGATSEGRTPVRAPWRALASGCSSYRRATGCPCSSMARWATCQASSDTHRSVCQRLFYVRFQVYRQKRVNLLCSLSLQYTTRCLPVCLSLSVCPQVSVRKLWGDPRRHPEAQKDGSAAPRGLDARHRLVGPRPHGALIDR